MNLLKPRKPFTQSKNCTGAVHGAEQNSARAEQKAQADKNLAKTKTKTKEEAKAKAEANA